MTQHITSAQTLPRTALAIQCIPSRRNPGLVERLGNALALGRTRRALARLDAAQLADIGVSPAQARNEAKRPVWDAPTGWTC